jgi:hypothetical protein
VNPDCAPVKTTPLVLIPTAAVLLVVLWGGMRVVRWRVAALVSAAQRGMADYGSRILRRRTRDSQQSRTIGALSRDEWLGLTLDREVAVRADRRLTNAWLQQSCAFHPDHRPTARRAMARHDWRAHNRRRHPRPHRSQRLSCQS